MRLIILGPPGAGKGTQAEKLAIEQGVPHISTGDIFRDNIKRKTPLGVQVKDVLDSGGYVTDEITNEIVKNRLHENDARQGFLLDGYPRTTSQVNALDVILAEAYLSLDAVLELKVNKHEIMQRLLKRAEASNRADDTESIIRERQAIYHQETAPLLRIYFHRELLVGIDGVSSLGKGAERIHEALDKIAASS